LILNLTGADPRLHGAYSLKDHATAQPESSNHSIAVFDLAATPTSTTVDAMEPMALDVGERRLTFKEKWELHKPLLGTLYFDLKLTVPKIQQHMRSEESFDAE
jgi:hypothetical protein